MNTQIENKLAFFPTPYLEEDFRSIIYRYHVRSLHISHERTKKEVLGYKGNTTLPRNLNEITERIPGNVTSDDIIYNHTLFPLLKPFLNEHLMDKVYRDLVSHPDLNKSINAKNYIKHIVSDEIRYCLDCIREDYNNLGEVYIHRLHQCKYIFVCYKHKKILLSNCPICETPLAEQKRFTFLGQPCCSNGHNLLDFKVSSLHEENHFIQEALLEDTSFLLSKARSLTHDYLKVKYLSWLYSKQYITLLGELFQPRAFVDDFINFFSTEVLDKLGMTEDYLRVKNRIWYQINFKKEVPNVALLLLISRFICSSFECFINKSLPNVSSIIPFGTGPWICENKYCLSYKKLSIKSCIRKVSRKDRITGTFCCLACGFTYVRSWDSQDIAEKINVSVVDHGHLWNDLIVSTYERTCSINKTATELKLTREIVKKYLPLLVGEIDSPYSSNHYSHQQVQAILETYSQYKSYRGTARKLGVNRNTVKKYVLLNLPKFENELLLDEIAVTAIDYQEERVNACRNKIVSIMSTVNNLKRSHLRKLIGYSTYRFMLKVDRDWMDEVLPPVSPHALNWDLVDKELSEHIKEKALSLYKQNITIRISKERIKKSLESFQRSRLARRPEKLPLSIAVIEQYEENKEDYQVRKKLSKESLRKGTDDIN
ncbi:TnsD family Tn7-like transposition protein [Robertmurraya sp.]|uniref:TnsD family Tn7-like transposition protein n=1 Tax=Robertmurraya sp. TaxID=2837525 RepID=UPI0037043AE8